MTKDITEARGRKKNSIHKTIRKMVRQHDLTHEYSDDSGAYRKGSDEKYEIQKKARRIPKKNFARIWNKEADRKVAKPSNKLFHMKEEKMTRKLSESIEDLQELSQNLIRQYRGKAIQVAATKQRELGSSATKEESKDSGVDRHVLGKRMRGLKNANKKLGASTPTPNRNTNYVPDDTPNDGARSDVVAGWNKWKAKSYGGSLKEATELDHGTDHEMEHTSDRKVAAKIAKDHLKERPDYYKKLDKCMNEEHRPVHQIAREIKREWGSKVNYGAKPYLDAMHSLQSHKDNYGQDSGKSVIGYFLSNANSYRGEKAKAHKAELKAMLKEETDIHEISKALMGRYLSKAKGDMRAKDHLAGMNHMAFITSKSKNDEKYRNNANELEKMSDKRSKGIGMVASKLMKESEDIHELKKSTLGSYIKKATGEAMDKSNEQGKHMRASNGFGDLMKRAREAGDKAKSRQRGINKATQKLVDGKHDKELKEGIVNNQTTAKPTVRRTNPTEYLNKLLGRKKAEATGRKS